MSVRLNECAAVSTLWEELLPTLRRYLHRRYPRANAFLIEEAAADALTEYQTRPANFDPSRGLPLIRFLGFNACRNLQNLLTREIKLKDRERAFQTSLFQTDVDPLSFLIHKQQHFRRLRHVLRHLDSNTERRFLLLRLRGESRVAILARALGLGDLEKSDQRLQLKRMRDCMRHRLRRIMEIGP